MPQEHPKFLKEKYWSQEEFREVTEKSAQKRKRLTGEPIPSKPQEQIPSYLERIKRVIERKDPQTGERSKLFLETSLYPKLLVKPQDIPDDYVKNIRLGNFAESKGYDRDKLKNPELKNQILNLFQQKAGASFENYRIPQEEQEQISQQIIQDQKASLDRWFEYLTGPEAKHYPDTFKYWALAELTKLGVYDSKRRDFTKRSPSTVAPFPELSQQALSWILDEVEKKHLGKPSLLPLSQDKQKEFQKRLASENFGKLYGWALDHLNSLKLPEERLMVTLGKWQRFPKGSNPQELATAIRDFNTEWCIAGKGLAGSYLSKSDVWVYFSEDADGSTSIPRAAIITDGQRISEVRGIAKTKNKDAKQHLDDYITPVVDEKLKDLPGGSEWQTSMANMRQLADIHFKQIQQKPFSREELLFLYEINHSIQSLGYGKDPRIKELKSQRNLKEDMLIIFECTQDQIANNPKEINENTKAYIGKLEPGIFNKIQEYNIEHVYRNFPEGRIKRETIESGGKDKNQLITELENKKNRIGDHAKPMLENKAFTTSKNREKVNLVRLTVKDLFSDNKNHTTQEIYQRAEELGLELCQAEDGPNYRLQYQDQPMGEYLRIAMKQISGRGGYPCVFRLGRHGDGLWLHAHWARPDDEWSPDDEFVFRLRKLEKET